MSKTKATSVTVSAEAIGDAFRTRRARGRAYMLLATYMPPNPLAHMRLADMIVDSYQAGNQDIDSLRADLNDRAAAWREDHPFLAELWDFFLEYILPILLELLIGLLG